jgi:hypothetical protein
MHDTRHVLLYIALIGCGVKRKFPTVEEKTAAVNVRQDANLTLSQASARSGVAATTIRRHQEKVIKKAKLRLVFMFA